MYQSKMQLKEQLTAAVELLVDSLFEKIESVVMQNPNNDIKGTEKIMSAKDVCKYYGFSLATLRRYEQEGLNRMNKNLKKKNRIFRFTDCEKFFNNKNN